MDNMEMDAAPKKQSLVSKVMWGGLITGAVIAVAAVVGFVFFPEQAGYLLEAAKSGVAATFNAIASIAGAVGDKMGISATTQESIYNTFSDAGKSVSNTVGTYDSDLVKRTAKMAADASNTASQSQWLGWVPFTGDSAAHARAGIAAEVASEAAQQGTGLVKFIINHKIISLIGAAIGGKAISNAIDSRGENEERQQINAESRESFALREDMKKMQAIMVARAKAAGYEPAMAMAQPTRG